MPRCTCVAVETAAVPTIRRYAAAGLVAFPADLDEAAWAATHARTAVGGVVLQALVHSQEGECLHRHTHKAGKEVRERFEDSP